MCPLESFPSSDKARLLLTMLTMMLTNCHPDPQDSPEEVLALTTETELRLTDKCVTLLLLLLDGPTEFDVFSVVDGSATLSWMMGFFPMQLFKVDTVCVLAHPG